MKIAITGATGFVGRHLARTLAGLGHETVLIARGRDVRDPTSRNLPHSTFVSADLSDPVPLAHAFAGCDAIAHCAGINREIGSQTYRAVHVDGTAHVIQGARRAKVPRVILLSFLRARPDCGSPYHESKWAAEELVRASGLDYTILKSGMIYGLGDHMLDHLSHTLHTLPLFATVGFREQPIRPVAIDDMVDLLLESILRGHLSRQTVFVLGPETLLLSDAVRRVAQAIGRRVWIIPAPVWFHRALAVVFERAMHIPLIAKAQVQMLAEGFLSAAPFADPLPPDLAPKRTFTPERIRQGLPAPAPFCVDSLRCWR
jgi:NADH dehydrogenase